MESNGYITSTVVRELEPSLVAYARRGGRQIEDAEDLVQDMWLSALRSTSPFAGRSTLRTWLIGILRHRMSDQYRRTRLMGSFDEMSSVGIDAGIVEQLELAQSARLAVESLQALTEPERAVLCLHGLNDLDRHEVCERLGITRVHFRVLLYRARRKLEGTATPSHESAH